MRLHQNCGRAQIKLTNAEAAPGLISLVLAADKSPAGPPFFKQLVIPVAAEVSGTVSLSRYPLGGRGNVSCGCTRRHLVDPCGGHPQRTLFLQWPVRFAVLAG